MMMEKSFRCLDDCHQVEQVGLEYKEACEYRCFEFFAHFLCFEFLLANFFVRVQVF